VQLRYLVSIHRASNHLIKRLLPQIRETLKEISPGTNRDFSQVMLWESHARDRVHSDDLWFTPIEAARYGLPLLVAQVSFVAYLIFVLQRSQVRFVIDGLLVLLDLLLLGYTVIMSFKVRTGTQKT
jgi:hypothetical protein